VKDILKDCRTPAVAGPLADDLSGYTRGTLHDELNWKDVALHGCRVLQGAEKVVFVSIWQLGLASVTRAADEGYRIVVVPEDIARSLGGMTDLEGNPMFDLMAFQREWNDSFTYEFVDIDDLSAAEQAVYALTGPAASLAGANLKKRKLEVLISETTRLSLGTSEVLGVWEPEENRIVVRRDQLVSADRYCATLLHELTHALKGGSDLTLEFEEDLTEVMGTVASNGLKPVAGPRHTRT
jgi:hypothetical protein